MELNIQILDQDVAHSLIFVGNLDRYESSSLSNQVSKVYLGSSAFEEIVVFQAYDKVHLVLDAHAPAKLNFARNFVVAVVDRKVLLWRNNWPEPQEVQTAWPNDRMMFHNDRFVMMADDNCLIYIDNDVEEIEYQYFNEIITEVRVDDGNLVVELWK